MRHVWPTAVVKERSLSSSRNSSHDLEPRFLADLCKFDNRTLLVISDDYHNYVEFARLHTVTFRAIIKDLKEKFARFGIPNSLKTDNGPQFASTEVSVFAKTWMFEHKTSSSTYAQSNGKVENAVQTVKRLIKKCKTSEDQNFKHFLISAVH